MPRAEDTSREAHRIQLEVWRRMGGEGRSRLAARMSEDAREVARAGIRNRHPDYSPEQVSHALFRLILGDTVYRSVWPGRSLLDP